MSFVLIAACALSIGALLYLLYVLANPEKF